MIRGRALCVMILPFLLRQPLGHALCDFGRQMLFDALPTEHHSGPDARDACVPEHWIVVVALVSRSGVKPLVVARPDVAAACRSSDSGFGVTGKIQGALSIDDEVAAADRAADRGTQQRGWRGWRLTQSQQGHGFVVDQRRAP